MPVSKKTKSTKKLIYNSATKDFKVISEEEFNRLPTTPDEVNFIPGKKSANIEVPGSFEAPYPGAPSDSETPKRKTIHVPVWLRPVIEWENITTVYVL
ncbi:hypothetical protein M7I_4243 [Glarea lozoyensis 74030]|nr:hypothetical protein M7I_4243 [Glarea lozoyensis 74030]